MAVEKVLLTFFGKIIARYDASESSRSTEVLVADYLLLKQFVFHLAGPVEVLCATHNHVFFLMPSSQKVVSCYLNSMNFAELKLSEDAFSDQKFQKITIPVETRKMPVSLSSGDDAPELEHVENLLDWATSIAACEPSSSSEASAFLMCSTESSCYLVNNLGDTPGLYRIFTESEDRAVKTMQIGCSDKIREISAGKGHMLLLSTAYEVYSFGTGSRGELGHGSLESEQLPVLLDVFDSVHIVQIACGSWCNVALTEEGDVYVWGWNCCGQFGRPISEISIVDTPYPLDIEDSIVAVSAFRGAIFLRKSDGSVTVLGSVAFVSH